MESNNNGNQKHETEPTVFRFTKVRTLTNIFNRVQQIINSNTQLKDAIDFPQVCNASINK